MKQLNSIYFSINNLIYYKHFLIPIFISYNIMPTYKSEYYKLYVFEYYLKEDKTQGSLMRRVDKYNENGEIKRHN